MLRALLVTALLASPLMAEAPTLNMTPQVPIIVQAPKSKAVAVGLEIVVPILGHGYAGNAKKGILPALVTFSGYVAIATTLDDDGEIKKDKESTAALGAVAVLAGRAWALVQVSRMVEEHNKRLSIQPMDRGRVGARVVVDF